MESTLSATTITLLAMSKTLTSSPNPYASRLHRHFCRTRPIECLGSRLLSLQLRRLFSSECHRSKALSSATQSSNSVWNTRALAVPLIQYRLRCVANSAASFASSAGGGGDGGVGGGGGGGGDGASEGGEGNAKSVVGESGDVTAAASDVIILDVGGMSCGGCAASVKRILESQPQVSTASVNLATETAVIWPISEAKVVPNWYKNIGETLAKHLTTCGFKSNLRGEHSPSQLFDLLAFAKIFGHVSISQSIIIKWGNLD